MHNIDDQDGNITERRASITQVAERLVARGVDDQKTGHFELVVFHILKTQNRAGLMFLSRNAFE